MPGCFARRRVALCRFVEEATQALHGQLAAAEAFEAGAGMRGHACVALRLLASDLETGPVGPAQGLPVGDVAQRAVGRARVVGPGGGFFRGVDDEGVVGVDVVDHRGIARSHGRLAAGHEFHQRQALAFAVGGVHHVAGGLDQPLVVRVGEVAVDQHDAAAVGLVLVQVVKHVGQRFADVVVGQFQHQGGVGLVAEGGAERADHVLPVLAPVVGVEHRGVDDPVEAQLDLFRRAVRQGQDLRRRLGVGMDGQVQLAAVHQQAVQAQAHIPGFGTARLLRGAVGEAIPDRRRHAQYRVVATHGGAHHVDREAGVGDGPSAVAQHMSPVVARFAVPGFAGEGAELPGEHRDGRAGMVDRRAMGRREGEEDAGFAALAAVVVEAVHQFVGIADFDHLADLFQQRTEFLEDEVIAVLRAPEVLPDGGLVGLGVNDDQHGTLPVAVAASSTPGAGVALRAERKGSRRWRTTSPAQ